MTATGRKRSVRFRAAQASKQSLQRHLAKLHCMPAEPATWGAFAIMAGHLRRLRHADRITGDCLHQNAQRSSRCGFPLFHIADRREAYAEADRELSLAQLETTKAKPEQVQGNPLPPKVGNE
jgi:hypothetical protein